MRQLEFERRHAAFWARCERWLAGRGLARGARERLRNLSGSTTADTLADAEFPSAYRRLCAHMALARERQYAPALVERLHQLVVDGHHALYSAALPALGPREPFLARRFPRLVRQEWRMVALAALLFFGPLLGLMLAVQVHPPLALIVVGPQQLADMQAMYQPDLDRLGRRASDTDLAMFGFYIWNNVRIGFQTFAGGVLFGLGSVFFLLFNGVFLGAVVGHLTEVGLGEQIWSFVAAHSAPELIAIALAGAAGLKLGAALLAPGRRSRARALVENGRTAFGLVAGAAWLFLLAALIEAFFSPLPLEPRVKYLVGLLGWILLLAWLALAGRPRRAA